MVGVAAGDELSVFESDVAAQLTARAASDAVRAELAVLRGVIAAALDESPALRYLGVFRPGAASLGGITAALFTVIALSVRVASLAVDVQSQR